MMDTFQNMDRQNIRRKERERYMKSIFYPTVPSTSIFDRIDKTTDLAPIADVLSGQPLEVQNTENTETGTQAHQNPSGTVTKTKQATAGWWSSKPKLLLCVVIPVTIAIAAAVLLTTSRTHSSDNIPNPRRNRLLSFLIDLQVAEERLVDTTSPAFSALEWLTRDVVDLKDYEAVRTRFALATLYYATTSAQQQSWSSNQHWLSEYPVCLWEGVTCIDPADDDRQQVRRLELDHHGLKGTFPSEISLLQRDLHVLDVSNNFLNGRIPDLGPLTNVERLYLGPNNFTHTIPGSIFTLKHLDHLYLDSCELSGSISSEIGNLVLLQGLGLEGNFFTGSIPSEIALLEDLRALYLDANELSGSLPSTLGNLNKVVDVRVSNNHLIGSLPTTLEKLKFLEVFHASGNELTGPLPPLGNLARDVHLFDNKLEGTLSREWVSTKGLLNFLYLDGNLLTGTLPDAWANPYLEFLHLFGNDFTGSLPDSLGDLNHLKDLRLQSNRLTGKLPLSLGKLAELQSLDLSSNLLSGPIPAELVNAALLVDVKLENNRLTGTAPWSPLAVESTTCALEVTVDCDEVECQCCTSCK